MSRGLKIVVGTLTFFLLGYMVLFMGFFILTMTQVASPETLFGLMDWIFPIHAVASLTSLGLFFTYLVHVITNKTMESGEKLVWVVLILFFNIIVYPVYWFLHMWRNKANNQTMNAVQVAETFE